MGTDIAISVSNLSKAYKIYSRPVHMLLEALTGRRWHREFWALKDVSLNIRKGEVVGFLGPNGSGKSTLLRIMADKLDYSSGDIKVHGAVTALFELGTGFNPELTGRDNIFQVGLYRGLSMKELNRKFDDIVEFSELEAFIDQPVKTYSNGMKARLAFSTAISIDPQILMIDEVLAVGDEAFSAKCSERMRDICESGATVLIVTHSTAYVSRLCDRAYYLEDGHILAEGRATDVCRMYDERMLARNAKRAAEGAVKNLSRSGADDQEKIELAIEDVRFESPRMPDSRVVIVGKPLRISFEIVSSQDMDDITVGIQFMRSVDNIYVASISNSKSFGGDFEQQNRPIHLRKGRNEFSVDIPSFNLGMGTYTISVGASRLNRSTWGAERLIYIKDIASLSVVSYGENQFVACELAADWQRGGDPLPVLAVDMQPAKAVSVSD